MSLLGHYSELVPDMGWGPSWDADARLDEASFTARQEAERVRAETELARVRAVHLDVLADLQAARDEAELTELTHRADRRDLIRRLRGKATVVPVAVPGTEPGRTEAVPGDDLVERLAAWAVEEGGQVPGAGRIRERYGVGTGRAQKLQEQAREVLAQGTTS